MPREGRVWSTRDKRSCAEHVFISIQPECSLVLRAILSRCEKHMRQAVRGHKASWSPCWPCSANYEYIMSNTFHIICIFIYRTEIEQPTSLFSWNPTASRLAITLNCKKSLIHSRCTWLHRYGGFWELKFNCPGHRNGHTPKPDEAPTADRMIFWGHLQLLLALPRFVVAL